jgi:hypothetical protein
LARRFTPHQAAGIIKRQDFKIIFQYHPLVPPGKDKSPYRKLSQDFVRIETFGLNEFIRVERESLRLFAERVMSDLDPIKDAKHRLRQREHSGKSGISDLQNNARIIDGVDGPASTASKCQGVAAGAPQRGRPSMKEFIIIGGVAVKHCLP